MVYLLSVGKYPRLYFKNLGERLEQVLQYYLIFRWVQVNSDKSTEKYREIRNDSDDDEDDEDIKPIIKSERLSPCELDTSLSQDNFVKVLPGLHLTFNLEAGSLLPLAIKYVFMLLLAIMYRELNVKKLFHFNRGRVMHGRHFTFKSILSNTAITIVAPSVTGTLVSQENPYVVQGPWLQVLLPDELSEQMAQEFHVFNSPNEVNQIKE